MRIGIMSMQRIGNYGSFLQSYSLKKCLENMGHTVEFVDYHVGMCKTERIVNQNSNKFWGRSAYLQFRRIGSNLLGVFSKEQRKRLKIAKQVKEYNESFEKYCFSLLGINEKKNYLPNVDLLIIGSDEVFNCLQSNPEVGYSLELFGKDNRAKRVITYAASFGNTTYERLKQMKVEQEIARYLEKLNNISVRDKNSYSIIKKLVKRESDKHLDPVFIYDYSEETSMNIQEHDYIIVYAYGNRIREEEAKYIVEFAKKYNKKIICLGMYQSFCDKYIPALPFEMLAYFQHADYVVTDTFHGTVFSIKFKKQFAVFVRETKENTYGNAEKLRDLLSTFDLKEREILSVKELESILVKKLDRKKIEEKISVETERSLEYLRENSRF